jgi:hypothetical protein
MPKKNTNLDMKPIAKALGTSVRKTKSADMGEFIKYNLPTLKGEMHYDGSGGIYFKPKALGLDCYIDNGKVLEQIAVMEEKIKAYVSLKADLKLLKKAVLAGTRKIPEKSDAVGSTKTSNVVSRSSRRSKKEAAAKEGKR